MDEELEVYECECNKKKIMIAGIVLAGLSLLALGTALFIKKRKSKED